MKKFIVFVLILFVALALTAYFYKSNVEVKPTTEKPTAITSSETNTTALTTEAATVTTEVPTTIFYQPIHINPEVVTGAPSSSVKTFTGYEPLSQVNFTVLDPDNSRGLSTKSTGFGFGLGKNGNQPIESIQNQNIFDNFDAIALDRKSTGKVLHLTFDCGYENGYTGKILDTLREKQVQAAFFCTFYFIKTEPELVTRMIKEGHIVGNHSTTHPVFPTISRTEMASEIQTCDNYLRLNFGYSAPYFRFPTGSYSTSSLDLVQSLGYRSVFWSVAYADWDPANQKGTQFAFNTVTSRLHPGAVILLHAVSKDNTAALGDIIDWARNQGYTFEIL